MHNTPKIGLVYKIIAVPGSDSRHTLGFEPARRRLNISAAASDCCSGAENNKMKAKDVMLLPLGVFLVLPQAVALICLVFWLTGYWPSNGIFQVCLWSASLLIYFHHKYIKQNSRSELPGPSAKMSVALTSLAPYPPAERK